MPTLEAIVGDLNNDATPKIDVRSSDGTQGVYLPFSDVVVVTMGQCRVVFTPFDPEFNAFAKVEPELKP